MADLVVIVPSRGRPEAARALAQAFSATSTGRTGLHFAIDGDDPTGADYQSIPAELSKDVQRRIKVYSLHNEGESMVWALNARANIYATPRPPRTSAFAVAFMGDDHMPRTVGWDERYLAALHEMGTGIVFGNDLLQGHRLPTQCAMTADIVRALGYMAPPFLTHLWVDNFWRDLGKAAGCLRYLPDVTIEHRHPIAGKAAWDEGYQRVNAPEVADHDRIAYEAYVADGGLDADVAKVLALRSVAA